MFGRVLATVYESLTTPRPSTPTRASCRRNPVIRLTRLATAMRLLARPSDEPRRRRPAPGGVAAGVTGEPAPGGSAAPGRVASGRAPSAGRARQAAGGVASLRGSGVPASPPAA